MDHLRRLTDHLEWADQRVLASLRESRTAVKAAIGLYSHVLGAEHTWISRITGDQPAVAIWPELSLDEAAKLASENVAGLREILSELDPGKLDRPVTYRNSKGDEFVTGLEDILLHVMLHGSYHRGQVAALLRSAGDEPSPTDYIQWVRGIPAATHSTG